MDHHEWGKNAPNEWKFPPHHYSASHVSFEVAMSIAGIEEQTFRTFTVGGHSLEALNELIASAGHGHITKAADGTPDTPCSAGKITGLRLGIVMQTSWTAHGNSFPITAEIIVIASGRIRLRTAILLSITILSMRIAHNKQTAGDN